VGVFRPEQKRGYLQTPAPPEKIAHVVSDRLARSETGRGGVLTRRTVVAYASALSLEIRKEGLRVARVGPRSSVFVARL
jgi:hypothetical protein